MHVGDAVEYVDPASNGEVYIIGEITAIEGPVEGDPDATLMVKFIEAHAFHNVWGASNGMRGQEHVVPMNALKPARTGWRHIVREGMKTYRHNPGKWDRRRAERADA